MAVDTIIVAVIGWFISPVIAKFMQFMVTRSNKNKPTSLETDRIPDREFPKLPPETSITSPIYTDRPPIEQGGTQQSLSPSSTFMAHHVGTYTGTFQSPNPPQNSHSHHTLGTAWPQSMVGNSPSYSSTSGTQQSLSPSSTFMAHHVGTYTDTSRSPNPQKSHSHHTLGTAWPQSLVGNSPSYSSTTAHSQSTQFPSYVEWLFGIHQRQSIDGSSQYSASYLHKGIGNNKNTCEPQSSSMSFVKHRNGRGSTGDTFQSFHSEGTTLGMWTGPQQGIGSSHYSISQNLLGASTSSYSGSWRRSITSNNSGPQQRIGSSHYSISQNLLGPSTSSYSGSWRRSITSNNSGPQQRIGSSHYSISQNLLGASTSSNSGSWRRSINSNNSAAAQAWDRVVNTSQSPASQVWGSVTNSSTSQARSRVSTSQSSASQAWSRLSTSQSSESQAWSSVSSSKSSLSQARSSVSTSKSSASQASSIVSTPKSSLSEALSKRVRTSKSSLSQAPSRVSTCGSSSSHTWSRISTCQSFRL